MKKQAFTLVELIVVITILAILGTIAFINLQSYSLGARDSKRLSDINNIFKKINIEQIKGLSGADFVDIQSTNTGIINNQITNINQGNPKFSILKENPDNFKDPTTKKDYVLSYAVSSTSTGVYRFTQIATVNEEKNEAVVKGNYFKIDLNDSPSIIKDINNQFVVNNGSNLPYKIITPSFDIAAIEEFKSVLTSKCGITSALFDTNFDKSTGIYMGNIDCVNSSLNNNDLDKFIVLKGVNGNLILGSPSPSVNRNIFSNVDGLVNLKSVDKLGLRYLDINDISGLRNLDYIYELDIAVNSISDLSPISNLITLRILNIEFSGINNISALSNLINLEYLYSMANPINNISMLTNLVNLKTFDFRSTQISELNSISGAINLQSLFISSSFISDISPIVNFSNLNYLYLVGSNNITNIGPIASLNKLNYIEIQGLAITDLSVLNTFSKSNSNSTRFYLSNSPYSVKLDANSPICLGYYTGGPTINKYEIVYDDGTYTPDTGAKKNYICN